MIIKCIPSTVEEKLENYHYKFIDRDGNMELGGEEDFKKVQNGGRLNFLVEEPLQYYRTFKKVRRRPVEIYKVSYIKRIEKLT